MRRASIKLIVRVALFGAASVTAASVVVAWPLLVAEWHIRQLSNGDLEARMQAAGRLGDLKSERAVPKLVEVFEGTLGSSLTSPEGSLGIIALSALGRIGPAGANGLIAAQGRWDPGMRRALLGATKQLRRHEARPLFTAIAKVLEDGDPSLRIAAIETLEGLQAPAELNVPLLISTLSDPDLVVQRKTLSLLRQRGAEANRALPVILSMAESRWDALESIPRTDQQLPLKRWAQEFADDFDWALREIQAGDDGGLRVRAAKLLEELEDGPEPTSGVTPICGGVK